MALLRRLQMQTVASQREPPLRLVHRQQIWWPLRLWHHGLRPEYPLLSQAFRPPALEPQPPWALPLPEPQEFRLLHLERESRRECRQSNQASQPELLLEQPTRSLAFLRLVQAHRYSRRVSQREFWPGYRQWTVLVQT